MKPPNTEIERKFLVVDDSWRGGLRVSGIVRDTSLPLRP